MESTGIWISLGSRELDIRKLDGWMGTGKPSASRTHRRTRFVWTSIGSVLHRPGRPRIGASAGRESLGPVPEMLWIPPAIKKMQGLQSSGCPLILLAISEWFTRSGPLGASPGERSPDQTWRGSRAADRFASSPTLGRRDNEEAHTPVSYTHLTLPTKLEV